jgi:hypothetical protein
MYNSFYGNNPARLNTNPISQGEHSIEPRSNSGVLCTIQTRELRKVQKKDYYGWERSPVIVACSDMATRIASYDRLVLR